MRQNFTSHQNLQRVEIGSPLLVFNLGKSTPKNPVCFPSDSWTSILNGDPARSSDILCFIYMDTFRYSSHEDSENMIEPSEHR